MLAIIGKYGRLGNQLWTYSNALACAMQNNFRITNTAFDSHGLFAARGPAKQHVVGGASLRKVLSLVFKANLRFNAFPHVHLGESALLDFDSDPDFVDFMHRQPLVFFSGLYFFAADSLIQNAGHVRAYFEVVEPLQERVSDLITRARDECDLLIGVHIRHGDYRTFSNGVMFYSAEEYAEIMHFLVEQFSGQSVAFLVCSDESQDLSRFRQLKVLHEQNDSIIDLYALSRCDYLIGPNSTFSQWSSFMGEVPLHVLRWKAQQRHQGKIPAHKSGTKLEFRPFSPKEFGKFSRKALRLTDVLKL